ncbi:MAG: ferredoxin [Phenylobacterium sp.]|uniref:FixH family protein n=1 Tax=Phenylobacterium sp. TaxID=1871053 RepID=UPI0025DCE682|nr:FixH family protein [Phenylobacterium sp.]MBI1199237.1 ferredoxin [Phenylobacterium sp.]
MSAVHPERPRGFRLTGWHVLAGISAFFAVIFAVDGTFAYMALRTHPGEVSVTPYEDGLLYNQRITQLEEQRQLGWRAAAGPLGTNKVLVEFRDRADAPVRGLTLTAKMERPATETGRITPRFVETAPGRYEATVGQLSGAWDLTAEAKDPSGDDFLLERRLTWP